jgi:hypothetical protein
MARSESRSDLKQMLGMWDEHEAAAFRGCGVAHLRNERARRIGPPYTKIGQKVFYPIDGLRKFLQKNTVDPLKRPLTLIDGKPRARGWPKKKVE